MEQFIEEINEDKLNFILCFYSNNVIYHEYKKESDSITTGSMMTTEALKSILNFVTFDPNLKITEHGFDSIIPPNVLKFSSKSKSIIWYSEEQVRTLMYKKVSNIKIPTGKYRVPAMLWKLDGNTLQVYALNSTEKISEKTKLHYAPFFNVNDQGTVCMGSAHFDNDYLDYDLIIKDAEVKFFNSYFTHSQNSFLLKKTNFIKYCNQVVDKNIFDNKLLIPNGKTIKNLL